MKARFTEKQPAVLWQELPGGKVDVTICLNEKEVKEEYDAETQNGLSGRNENTAEPVREKVTQTLWEYDFNQFREKTEKINKEDVKKNPGNYLNYTPQWEKENPGDLEKEVYALKKEVSGFSEAIEKGGDGIDGQRGLESLIRFARISLEGDVKKDEDKTVAIACYGLFPEWKPGVFETGDIRRDQKKPYECIQDHDSIKNPQWTIKERSLWKPYHSRLPEWALPWEAPTGAHDIYKTGEFMVFTDGEIYKATQDTNFSPKDYPQAWEKQ